MSTQSTMAEDSWPRPPNGKRLSLRSLVIKKGTSLLFHSERDKRTSLLFHSERDKRASLLFYSERDKRASLLFHSEMNNLTAGLYI